MKSMQRLPVGIAVLAKADLDEPWLAVEQTLGEVKRAVELEDRSLGHLLKQPLERAGTQTLEREPGSETVGLITTYLCFYAEPWGEP